MWFLSLDWILTVTVVELDFESGLGFDLEYFEFAMTVGYPSRDKNLINRWKYTAGACGRYKALKIFFSLSALM